jgi:hypothetical protein
MTNIYLIFYNIFIKYLFVKILLEYIYNVLDIKKLKICNQDRLLIANFFTRAFVFVILDWFENGQKETPEQIRKQLCRIQQNIIVNCLHVTSKNKAIFIKGYNIQ